MLCWPFALPWHFVFRLPPCSSSSGGDGEDVAEDDQIKAEAGGSVSLPEGFTVPEEAAALPPRHRATPCTAPLP